MKSKSLIILLACLILGCAPKPKPKTTLRFMTRGAAVELGICKKVITDFEGAHPNIRVKMEHVSWSDYWEKLMMTIAGKTALGYPNASWTTAQFLTTAKKLTAVKFVCGLMFKYKVAPHITPAMCLGYKW